jgi:hypothetical protein
MNLGFNNLWPTKVLVQNIEDQSLLEEVANNILLNYVHAPLSDFQDFDLLKDGGDCYAKFKKEIVYPAFDQYLKEVFNIKLSQCKNHFFRSWLAGPKSGYSIHTHNHSGACISAIFYILCEEQDQGGELVMIDPRGNANRGYPEDMKHEFSDIIYKPKSGQVVIFPSFLYHYTKLFTGNLRIAMPVDFFPGRISKKIG